MLNILLVDDEPDLLEIYQGHLESYISARYITASNGKEALELFKTNNFDMVISDINMPLMNGLELLKILREKQIFVPFIFITGYGDAEKIRTAWQFGASDFIEKPVNSKTFGSSVQSVAALIGSNNTTGLTQKLGQGKAFVRFDLFLDAPRYKKLKEYCDKNLVSFHSVITELVDKNLN